MRLCALFQRGQAEDGYTLIEALAALAVTAAGLAAIGQLGFTTVAAAHRSQMRLELTAAARSVFAAAANAQTGVEGGAEWRLEYAPFAFTAPGAPPRPAWTPQAMRVIVRSASGAQITVDSVRLRPASAAR